MSTSKSHSSKNDYKCGSRLCSCMLSDEDSESSEKEYYVSSVTDESSSDDYIDFNKKICFINVFDTKNKKDTFFICNYTEILEYRKKYKRLSQNSKNTINTLWGNVKVYIPWLGCVPLKVYQKNLVENKSINNNDNNNRQDTNLLQDNKNIKICISNNKSKKKIFKKPSDKQVSEIVSSSSKSTDKLNVNEIKVNDNSNNITDLLFSSLKLEKEKLPLQIVKSNLQEKNKQSEIQKTPKKNKTVSEENNLQSKENKTDNNFEFKKLDEKISIACSSQVKSTVTNNIETNLTVNECKIDNLINHSDTKDKLIINTVIEKKIIDTEKDTNFVNEISKKKQKKLRQKEKKQEEKKSFSNSTTPKKLKKKTAKCNKVDCQSPNQDTEQNISDSANDTSDEDIKQVLNNDNTPSFYIEIFKRNEKFQNKKLKKTKTSTLIMANTFGSESENEDFVLKSKKRGKNVPAIKTNKEESEKYGEEAVDMILRNKIYKAINYLTTAVNLNPLDYRHYLNRCYCYLRTEKLSFALEDAQFVIQHSRNLGFLFIANLRAGQSANLLKKYSQAETFLREALDIYPDSPHAQRELYRVQINRIMQHEHPEKNAVIALENCSSTMDAIKYLDETYIPKSDDNDVLEIFAFDDEYDNQIYESDDEKSIAKSLNKLMKCNPEEVKLRHIAQPLLTWLRPSNEIDKYKTSPASSKSSSVKSEKVIENAVWIGSLTPEITELMVKKVFKQYGNISSIHIVEGKYFGFVNFEKREDVAKLLSSTTTVRVNGIDVKLRAAIRKD